MHVADNQEQLWPLPGRPHKVEWHPGELVPRVGFIVTNMSRPAERVVAFYNGRGTRSNGSRRARARSGGRGCHAGRSPPIRSDFSSRSPTASSSASTAPCWRNSSARSCTRSCSRVSRRYRPSWTPGYATTTIPHHNTHLSMWLKQKGFADLDVIPRCNFRAAGRVQLQHARRDSSSVARLKIQGPSTSG